MLRDDFVLGEVDDLVGIEAVAGQRRLRDATSTL